jgi:molybdenum cofactor cytidylyltransferase
MNAVAAVLAAGASRRLGTAKQLLQLPDGSSLVRRSAQLVQGSRARRCAVVVGADAARVIESLDGTAVDIVSSEDHHEGIAASIRAAVTWAGEEQASALLICVCDQPALATPHLNSLLDTWSEQQCLVASHYAQKRAVPAVFPARYFAELKGLRGDLGAAAILKAASRITLVPWPEGELDIDTPFDWQKASQSRLVRGPKRRS